MRSSALFKAIPLVIATAIPFGLVSCSSDEADDTSTGGTSSGATGGTGGASGSGTGGSTSGSAGQATGGATATGGTGGSTGGAGTGGSAGMSHGGAGASAGGSAGRSGAGAGGMGGSGPAGGGGQGGAATGGASAGGASSGGMGTGGASSGGASSGGMSSGGMAGSTSGGTFTLTSPQQMDGAKFDAKYTCDAPGEKQGQLGNGVIPELDWTGVPAGTKSFAITFIDTTLGETSQFGQHWAMWNIPASAMKIPEAMPATVPAELMPAKQSGAFLTPCAQSLMNNMDDQYEFTIYALSTDTLSVSGTSVKNVLDALKAAMSAQLGTAKLKGHAGLKGK